MAQEAKEGPVPGSELAPPAPPAPPRPEPLDEPGLVRHLTADIIHLMGIRGRVEVCETAEAWVADIHSRRAAGMLIGRQGETLDALGHIVHLIVQRRFPHCRPVIMDIAGYRHRQEQYLRGKAAAVASIVTSTGREMAVDFLTEPEFHIVKEALADNHAVRVHAVGDGPRRDVVISPVRR